MFWIGTDGSICCVLDDDRRCWMKKKKNLSYLHQTCACGMQSHRTSYILDGFTLVMRFFSFHRFTRGNFLFTNELANAKIFDKLIS